MAVDRQFAFGRIRFDARTGEVVRGRSQVRLTPRAASVLAALAESAEQLVTKQELFDRVWNGRAVGDDALTSCIQELRQALGDDARRPRYIETKHRRGYRLMVPLAARERASSAPTALVGRAAELAELANSFDQALSGRRQMVFVGGEPGIGKSALVDAFLTQLAAEHPVRIAHGQCLDHHGVGEPYLPLMEALTRLAGGSDGAPVKRILRFDAPSWLAQMPSLWTKAERSALEARGRPTRDRMLRELAHAIETMSADVPLVFVLEDIHWSDASTLDWLAHVARRPEPARLMTIATLRPADPMAIRTGLPAVVSELALHGQCRNVALAPLDLRAIEVYLAVRLGDDGGIAQSREMAPLLLDRTGGNPLFMTSIVNQLAQLEGAARTPGAIGSIPHDVRRFIDRQIDEVDERDRNLLTAASVIRREFATAAVAAALEIDVEQVETDCARLARQGVFIVRAGSAASATSSSASSSWPDGTRTDLYSFRHDLYREVLYDRLSATRRALGHARVGCRLEAAWSGRLDAIAAELADHFDRGNEPVRAIPHHRRAAAKALRRSANAEAIGHLRSALDAIGRIADEGERSAVEVGLLIGLGAAFMATRGFGAPEVLEVYSRAEALCEQLGERADIFPAMWGQWLFRWGRSEIDTAWRLCLRLLALAEKSGDALLKLQAHHAAWATSFGRGELADVHAHARAGFALYDAKIHQATASSYGNHDANACARYFSALALALAGESKRARAMADGALAAARSLDDPFTLALTLAFASIMAQMLGDAALATRHAQASRQMAIEHDLAMPKAWSTGVLGWCAAEAGDPARGVVLLTESIAALQTAYSRHFLSYQLGLLADVQMKLGHHAEAMAAVENAIAFVDAGGERYYAPELHRLQGELLARAPYGDRRKAETSFRAAIKIAGQQGATALQRKADASLRRWRG